MRIAPLGLLLTVGLFPSCDREPPQDRGSWDPLEGEVLLSSTLDGDLEIYRFGDGRWTNVTRHEGPDNWPQWSPDGRRIVFQSQRSGNLDVWVMNADGSGPVQLTDDPAADYVPEWTPDGTHISFTSMRREPSDPPDGPADAKHIYIMRADGSDARRLVEAPLGTSSGAAWSPDGGSIVYTRVVGEGSGDVYRLDLESGRETRLTEKAAYCGSAVFSPDGGRIAFYAEDDTEARIVVMDRDGSNATAVTGGGRHYYPRWSPDGEWLLLTALVPAGEGERLDLLAVPASGGDLVPVIPGDARKSEGSWRPIQD